MDRNVQYFIEFFQSVFGIHIHITISFVMSALKENITITDIHCSQLFIQSSILEVRYTDIVHCLYRQSRCHWQGHRVRRCPSMRPTRAGIFPYMNPPWSSCGYPDSTRFGGQSRSCTWTDRSAGRMCGFEHVPHPLVRGSRREWTIPVGSATKAEVGNSVLLALFRRKKMEYLRVKEFLQMML